ncbi:MAG: Ig-like domain-containing protein, partial [Bacteroidota bacterium]|nr:Ig-like domain-containing protein [Bacteroidota bacterium]
TKGTFSGSGTTYTLLVTPSGSADVVVTVAADAATDGLNTGPTSAVSATAIWDAAALTVAISGVPAIINSTAALNVTFTFSKAVSGFVTQDVMVTGGMKGTFFAANTTTYTLMVTPTSGSNVTVTVAADAATDGLTTGPASAVSATAIWDSSIPTVAIMGVPPKIRTKTGFTATFTFSEDVTGFVKDDVTVSGGTKGIFTATNQAAYTLAVTPSGSADVVVTVTAGAATDGINAGPASAVSATATWDVAAPTVTITDVPAKINSTDQFTAKFTFSEAVTGFVTGDVSVTGGKKGTFSGSGTTYTLLVTPSGSADVVVTVAADAATDGLNTGPASEVSATATWDAAALTVAIGGVPAKINSRTTLNVTFTFSKAVTGFETGDVAVTGGGKSAFSGSGRSYAVSVTPSGLAHQLVVTVAAHAATDGVTTGPALPVSATAIWDASVPIVAIGGVPAKINSRTTLNVTFTFSEAVTGFVTDDVTVGGGTKGTFSATNASSYTLQVTPSGSADVVVTVAADAATDGINTAPVSAVSATANWDAIAPTVTITDVPAKINSTSAFTATFTFSEDVTGFAIGDVTVTGGSTGTFTATNTTTYTLAITPTSGSNVTVEVAANAATDGLNTGPTSAVSETATWDATAPTIAITDVPATISSTTDFTATFTFSEDVTGFATGDVSVSGGTKGTFTATNAQTYTLVITPSGSADVVVTVAADAATDGLNTGPASAVSATATWDAIPTVSISGLPPKINSTTPLTATFTFSEDVTGFTTQDVGIQGGTKGTFSGSGASYTLGVTPSGSADMLIIVVQDAATDAGSNTGPATAQSFESFWDVVAPTVSITNVPSKISSTRAFTARFTFSEEVTGFESGDVTTSGGTNGTFTAVSEDIYTLVVTPNGSADVVVTVAADAASDGANTGPTSAVSATATWDATPRNVLTSVSTLEIAEGSSGSYTVRLSSQPSGSVSMTITGTSFTDLTLDKTRLTFNPTGTTNLWSDPQTVTVTVDQDVDWNTDNVTLINTASGGEYGGVRAYVSIRTNDDETGPSPPHAYVVQSVHSFFNSVPLIAEEAAWLRIFPTANAANSISIPTAVATFYRNNQVTHTVNFASKTGPIPTEVWPQGDRLSYNAEIPASVIQSGLELVVEIDPDDTVPASLGVAKRIPQSGRISLGVVTAPDFNVTIVPLVTTGFTGFHDVEAIAQRVAASPDSDALLAGVRTLLPVKDISATAHATVTVSDRGIVFLINKVIALRVLEGGSGYWMGLHTDPLGGAGFARLGGSVSISIPNSIIIAHEFGHNLSLRHAPCGEGIVGVDANYPYSDGSIGSWGLNNNTIVYPDGTYDLMSYCFPRWISDYHFKKAADFRTSPAFSTIAEPPVAAKSSEPSLLLWGGIDADLRPYLEPIFVVEAAPSLPEASGPWQLVGHMASGTEMFNLTFAMPELDHGDGASAFAFVVPLEQDQVLNSVTLFGPGGSFTIDGEHNDPMAIVIDEATGQVTGFLKDFDPSGDSRVSAISNKFGGNAQRVLFSRGIPDPNVQN